MTTSRKSGDADARRGLLARPLDALVFLLPMLLYYEIMSALRPERVIAFDWTRGFFELFGYAGMWAPPLTVIVILLATHVASGQRWRVHWGRVAMMYPEAILLALPLLALNRWMPLVAADGVSTLNERLAMGVGAGIYEELVFRLVLLSLLVMIGVDLFRLDRTAVTVGAVVLSALAFAAHHHPPIGHEPFRWMPFLFRSIAGVYLAVVFWFRGYGPAAGCHAAYNVALTLLDSGAGG